MPESLTDQFISDFYTSLIHLSGSEVGTDLNKIFDGAGNSTGLAVSGDRVVINNYIYPDGGLNPVEWLDAFFPVGCLQLTFDNNNPETRIAGTTWEHVAEGRFIVGVGECYADKNGIRYGFAPGDPTVEGSDDASTSLRKDGNEAGEYRVTLVTEDLPTHTHETDINGVKVQIDSPVGSGPVFEPTGQVVGGEIQSTPRFEAEQRARNLLAGAVGWNFNASPNTNTEELPNLFGYPATPDLLDRYKAFLRALDLNFERGTSKLYPESVRNDYLAPAESSTGGLVWKEMIGLWNGETRFVPTFCPRTNVAADPAFPEIDRDLGPVGWILSQTFGDNDAQLGQYVADADNSAFLVANQQLPEVVGGPNQALLQHSDTHAFRTSTRVGLGVGHNNIPPSYGAYVWKRTS